MGNELKMREATENHLMNIQFLKDNPNPSKEQLEKMYGYLDYCLGCEKRFKFAEPSSHGFEGNVHKFGCSIFARTCGYFYQLTKLILIPIWLPMLLVLVLIEWISDKLQETK